MRLSGIGHYGFGIEAPSYAELVAGAEATIADIERSMTQQVPVTGWAGPTASPFQVMPPAPGAPLPDDRGSWLVWGVGIAAVVGAFYYFGKKKKT